MRVLPDQVATTNSDLEIVMVDLAFWNDGFEQDQTWDDFGTTTSDVGYRSRCRFY